MEIQEDFAFPYYEERETDKLIKGTFYREQKGIGPAGAIISNIEDISKWVITLMNHGEYEGVNVISSDIIKETLQPAIVIPNTDLENNGYDEFLNPVYGMGRRISVYKGHYLTLHWGHIDGFYSIVSMMPYDSIGVIVFVNGEHNRPLVDIISFNIYDRLLGVKHTDFNGRSLKNRKDGKTAGQEARKEAGSDKVANTKPSHHLSDYQGQYENSAYGILNIALEEEQLMFDFHNIVLPLEHYHYDRFDTPHHQIYGKYSVNFYSNPQGDIDKAVISLDESEVAFIKKPSASLYDPNTLITYVGNYVLAGDEIKIIMKDKGVLTIKIPRKPDFTLVPYKPHMFTLKEFSDYMIEFIIDGDEVIMMKGILPNGTYNYVKK
jgi:hypothetical protein